MNNELPSITTLFKSFLHWPKMIRLLWDIDRKAILIIASLSIFEGLLPPAILLTNQRLINSIQLGEFEVIKSLLVVFSILVLLYFSQITISAIQNYYNETFQSRLSYSISALVMNKSSRLSLKDFENDKIYDQMQRVMGESGHRPYATLSQILSILSISINLIFTSLILVIWKWWILIILLIIPVCSTISFYKLSRLDFSIRWARTPLSRKLWYFSNLLTRDFSVKEIKIFNLSDHILKKYRDTNEQFYNVDKELIRKKTKVTFILDSLNQLILFGLMGYIIILTFTKVILIGSMVIYLQALTNTQKLFQGLMQELFSIYENNLYTALLFDFLDLEESELSTNNHEELRNINSIEFKNVYFKYQGDSHYSLKNINFHIKQNEVIAIVGKNGSGKSTLIKLLTGLYHEYEGEILINGTSLKKYSNSSLRENIGVIFQDFLKYELTARENIGFGDIKNLNNDQEINKALKSTKSEKLIAKMPSKLETQLGKIFSDGYQLSGGEWQKMAINRAVFKNASLYILDEPSAALDPYSEKEFFTNFDNIVKDKIGIYISHRFTTVKQATKIFVFDKGEIIEQDTHDVLMSNKEFYHDIYMAQASSYNNTSYAKDDTESERNYVY